MKINQAKSKSASFQTWPVKALFPDLTCFEFNEAAHIGEFYSPL